MGRAGSSRPRLSLPMPPAEPHASAKHQALLRLPPSRTHCCEHTGSDLAERGRKGWKFEKERVGSTCNVSRGLRSPLFACLQSLAVLNSMSVPHLRVGQDFEPGDDQSQYRHPKTERAEAKRAKDRFKNREPIHPSKGVSQPLISHKATLGDKAAHSHDSVQLCPRLLPVDWQEFRGCKSRDVDRRTKCWNKEVYLDSFPGGGGASDGE